MMTLIRCDECHKSGMFDIHFKFILECHLCEKCSHPTEEAWDMYFCNTACLFSWLRKNEIEEKGFPCRSCRDSHGNPTGFAWGFQQNGTCKTCDGSQRVAGHRKQAWEFTSGAS